MARSAARLTGDWGKLAATLSTLSAQFPAAVQAALQEEGQFYRKKIIEGITSQAPGGKAFKPLSPTTLAIRKATGFGGTKALIRTGDLRNSVSVAQAGKGAIFVGVLYTARGEDGRKLADIAKINEYGATIRTVLTKARLRFLRGIMRKARLSSGDSGREQGAVGFTRIPPRPFLQPIFDMYSGMRGGLRFQARVAQKLGGMLGVLNHPDLGGKNPVAIPGKLLGGKGAKMVNKAILAPGGKNTLSRQIRNAFKARKPTRASALRTKPKPVKGRVKRRSTPTAARSPKVRTSRLRPLAKGKTRQLRLKGFPRDSMKATTRSKVSRQPKAKLPKLPKGLKLQKAPKQPKARKPRAQQLSLRFPKPKKTSSAS